MRNEKPETILIRYYTIVNFPIGSIEKVAGTCGLSAGRSGLSRKNPTPWEVNGKGTAGFRRFEEELTTMGIFWKRLSLSDLDR